MIFAAPYWLWLLVSVPVMAVIDWRSAGPRRAWTTPLRAAVVAAVVLTLARPMLAWQDVSPIIVTVIDLSSDGTSSGQSVDAATGARGPVVAFASRATVVTDPATLANASDRSDLRRQLARPLWSDEAPDAGANLADALRLAGSLIPPGGRGQIRLLSSGRCDHGDAAAEAWRLARRGIGVVPQWVDVAPTAAVRVAGVAVPSAARVRQVIRAEVAVESALATRVTVRLTAGADAPVSFTADVTPGINHVIVPLPLATTGLQPIRATAEVSGVSPATRPSVADVRAAIQVGGPATVLLVQDPAAGPALAQTLATLVGRGADVRRIAPADLPTDRPTDADAVVLADVPADQLPASSQNMLRQAVGDGTGLLLTGAARSFGPGGYDDAPLAPLLPVRMTQEAESINPSTALVLIIDTSGSMKGDRIDLAKTVARLALSHLRPRDMVGIVEFYNGKRWAAPVQSVGNQSVVQRALDRLKPGGGGDTMYVAVEEAAFALRNVRTRSKHVLICSDGFVEEAPFEPLLRQMTENGIIVSTVQVAASDGRPNQMPDIARWGGGRFYTVFDSYAMPDISLKQPQISLTSPLVSTPSPLEIGGDPLLAGSNAADFGEVNGYVRTQPKPTADVLLKTAGGDPLLARWRWGAGYVATMPTQLGSIMAADLQQKPAFARLMADLVRQIGSGRDDPLRVSATARPAGVEVDVIAAEDSPHSKGGGLQVTLIDADGKAVRSASGEAIRPGHWNLLFPGVTAGAYTLRAAAPGGATGSGGVAVPPPGPAMFADRALLDQVGSFQALAGRQAAALPPGRDVFFDARPWSVIAAVTFLLAHVAVRRWPHRAGRPVAAVVKPAALRTPSAGPAGAAVALLVATLFAASVAAAPPATAPATRAADWDQRIADALISTGSVDAVASSLAAAPDDGPGVARARVRVAVEQGDLAAALQFLRAALVLEPSDYGLLRERAAFEEMADATAAAGRTWEAAAAAAPNAAAAAEAMLRQAILDLDDRRTAEGIALLRRAAAASPSAATGAGVIAYLYGHYETAADCLRGAAGQAKGQDQAKGPDAVGQDAVSLLLLEGNAALKSRRLDAATSAFERALALSRKASDRLYAQERVIAVARAAGTLPRLADRWMADPKLPSERMLALAMVLRELGRTTQLLDWWKATSADPDRSTAVLSERFVAEVLATARAAGQDNQAIAICRELLSRHPDDEQWLAATLQAMLAGGRSADADALLGPVIRASADDPSRLVRLARLARTQGRDGPAREAARALVALGGGNAIDGQLLQAVIHQQAGDRAAAADLLRQASSAALTHPVALTQVVSALEGAGMNGQAIELLQQSIRREPFSDGALGRLASLLLAGHREADAIPVLRQLMTNGSSAAVRGQAGERLLDAMEATGRLKDMVRQLRARLDAGEGNEQDLTLLINADLRLHDTADAINVLQGSKLLDEPARLGRLAVLHLRTKNFDAAASALRQLATADPDNATETLERLADTHLKRNRPDEAAGVVDEIARRIGQGPASAEMMAGVLDRLGRPGDAADGYRRALALDPSNAADWLLWSTAMTKARRGTPALHRLQILSGEAATDNVFATAVDGLLNLSAPAPALRAVRREAALRIARRPRSTMLYNVFADVSEELNDNLAQVRAVETNVATGDEERPERLRELMDVATQRGDVDTAVDCGRSLLAIGDDYPPALFLQLGEQLLIAGRQDDASRAFARAAESSDPQLVMSRAAAFYRKYGYLTAALEALRPLADGPRRHDPDYLESLADLNEQVGQIDLAFDHYMAGIKAVSGDVAADVTPIQPFDPNMPPPPFIRAFGRCTEGAVATAREASRQTKLIGLLRDEVTAALAGQSALPAPSEGLAALVAGLRGAAFAFARPDLADAADAEVLAHWPDAEAYKRQAFDTRVRAGMIDRATTFAAAQGLDAGPSAAPAGVEAVATTAPARSPSAGKPPSTASSRPAVVARQTDVSDAMLPMPRPADADASIAAALAGITAKGYDPAGRAARIVLSVPTGVRARVLDGALTRVPTDARLSLLADLVAGAPLPFDDATSAAIVVAGRQMPPGQVIGWSDWFGNVAQKQVLTSLADAVVRTAVDPARPDVGVTLVMAAAAFANGGDTARADMTATRATAALKKMSPAESAQTPRPPVRAGLLRVAVSSMSPAARANLIAGTDGVASGILSQADLVWTHLLRSVLLDAVGRRVDGLAELRASFDADPSDMAVGQVYIERLCEDGRWAEVCAVFKRKAAVVDLATYRIHQAVARGLANLYRWRELRGFSDDTSGPTPAPSVDLARAVAAGDVDSMTTALRSLLQDARISHGFVPLEHIPSGGGLRTTPTPGAAGLPAVFKEIRNWPGAPADILRNLRAPKLATGPLYDGAVSWSPALLARASGDPAVFDQVAKVIGPAVTTHTLNPAERELITAMSVEPGLRVPTAWLDALRPAAMADKSGVERKRFEQAWAAQHAPESAAAVPEEKVSTNGSSRTGGREESRRLPSRLESPADDSLAADEFAARADTDPSAAEASLGQLFEAGRLTVRSLNAQAVWARVAAERGDTAAFKERVQRLLAAWAWQRLTPAEDFLMSDPSRRRLRLSLCIPTRGSDADRHQAVVEVLAPALASLAEAWPAQADITRQLALLGEWALDHGDRAAAETLCAQAMTLAKRQGPGEHQLWPVDLATRLGHEPLAAGIDAGLLEERCLPAVRIASTLNDLVKSGDVARAKRLRMDAESYCPLVSPTENARPDASAGQASSDSSASEFSR